MTAFFRGAKEHLDAGGRMLVFFGTSGDLAYLKRLMRDEGFAAQVVARDEMTRDGWCVEYFTFRVTAIGGSPAYPMPFRRYGGDSDAAGGDTT